jgi:hypothetical protein
MLYLPQLPQDETEADTYVYTRSVLVTPWPRQYRIVRSEGSRLYAPAPSVFTLSLFRQDRDISVSIMTSKQESG